MALGRGLRETFDWPLFVCVMAISILGVINLYSATSANRQYADLYIQQIYWLTLGAGVGTLVAHGARKLLAHPAAAVRALREAAQRFAAQARGRHPALRPRRARACRLARLSLSLSPPLPLASPA